VKVGSSERWVLVRSALRAPIPERVRADLGFGALITAMFLVEVFTGILLSLYYQPSPETVEASVQFIMRDVSWGWLVRGVHHWASGGLVALCVLHLLRVFIGARYRDGRAWLWYLGALALVFIAVSTFTGEILGWDNAAYWRVRGLLAQVESVPFVGRELADILRGGAEVSATTLSRTYSLHTMFVPWLVWMLLLANVALLVREVRRGRGAVQ
jgi:quinol-cytochrome oxidoreductase complex cytochrome b subunit